MSRRTLVAVLVPLVLLAGAPPVWAVDGHGDGHLHHRGRIDVGVIVRQPGTDGPIEIGAHSHTPLIIWTVIDNGPAKTGDLSALCRPAAGQLGYLYHLVGHTANGALVADRMLCIPVAPGETPAPPPAPETPTLEGAWRAARVPAPVIGLDPDVRGVTGLDTRIWTESGTDLTLDASVDGYHMTGTATVTGYRVRVDDEPVLTTDVAGSASNPVAHHIFETKGEHAVRVGVVWHGVATFAGPDLPAPVTVDIGDATITATRAYPVTEIRSVLQP